MSRITFWKGLVFTVVVLFVGTSLGPLANSASTAQSNYIDSIKGTSIQNDFAERKDQPPTPLTGLAPHTTRVTTRTTAGKIQPMLSGSWGDFFGYNVYDPTYQLDQGPVTFYDDAIVDLLQPTWIDFISGSDFDFDNNWYAVKYYGGLYQINPNNGDMTFIANTIPWLTSLVIDKTTSTWYVSDLYGLYTIDIETGETTFVGPYEITNFIISLMVDDYGNMYGYDVVGAGHSTLYHIDKTTGFATPIGDMGHTFCYAQEGKFDRLSTTLYLAAYDIGMDQSYLATCNPNTAEVTIINQFSPLGIEIDALTSPWNWLIPGVGVNEINAPTSGDAQIIAPEVTIQNHGWYDIDDVPVNITIVKNQYTDHMNEHFNESTFPPEGWSNLAATDYWVQSSTSYAGGTTPEAVLWSYNNYGGTGGLQSAYVNTSCATSLTLKFRSYIEWAGGPCNCTVEVTGDGGTTWHDISPWINPLMVSQLPWQFTINISAYRGTQTGVRFIYLGQYNWVNFWAIDDIRMYTRDQLPEYNQTIYTDIPAGKTMSIIFPDWTPSDLGISENVSWKYVVNATTQFSGNYFPYDYKHETFTLNFGYFHDVAITAITSPQSGPSQTQPCHVVLENHGQDTENISVNMIIGKPSYTTLIQENFSNGVPPTEWGTDQAYVCWVSSPTNYAGGTIPEAEFFKTISWLTGDFHLYTPGFNTTGWTIATLKFKEYVVTHTGAFTLKIQTSTDGGATWNDAYTRAGNAYGPTTTQVTLSTANGVGSNDLMISFTYSTSNWNQNEWYIDDVWFGQANIIDIEYNQTVSAIINPIQGASMNITLPNWTPEGIPLIADVDYLIDATVSLNTSDENLADNGLPKLITLQYQHDVGVAEITQPSDPQHPGTYPVAGIVENYGVIYSETNIPVEARITHIYNNTVIYDQAVTYTGTLYPGQTAQVTFPDFTLLNLTGWEGKYKVEIWTSLPGDDHPDNDKASMTFTMVIPDVIAPITNHSLEGTLGLNGWYVSKVVVTLIAIDPFPPVKSGPKPPSGVDHTYYKLHASEPWTEYISDFNVDAEGLYELYYYSVDNAGNSETEKGPYTFKIDKTAPAITLTVTSLNLMKTMWLLNATVSDNMSGVNRVEFYVDYASVGIVTKPGPYTWTYQGSGKVASAIVYDDAGNAMSSPYVTCQDLLMQANNEVLSMHQNSALMTLTQRFLVSR